ncbi:hypothetical protein IFT48_00585 [Pseudomonas fluorescens]|uniref:hypothetical protein n=1 Tax=Pseudomonas fluorescens TaxID=294 RepID=UPI00177FB3AC|nr:hypothetical protein [Pseudomonas fluorescens]MBD8088487.1 hypothetical protein [Pseudomonas fluorescens]MBD8615066.1 hypothetical protein [Pseudomonas putida]
MGKVIDGSDRFELKKGLDEAVDNLSIIVDGVRGGGVASGDYSEAAIGYVERFLSGHIQPHYDILEDSDTLYCLMKQDQPRYQTLIGYVMRYAHSDCHCLSIALTEINPNIRLLKVVDSMGVPMHSCIAGADDALVLDANGVHLSESLLSHWSRILGAPVRLLPTTAQELFFFSGYGDEELIEATNGFGYLSLFMSEREVELSIASIEELDEPGLDI